jgi:hypothetical protein
MMSRVAFLSPDLEKTRSIINSWLNIGIEPISIVDARDVRPKVVTSMSSDFSILGTQNPPDLIILDALPLCGVADLALADHTDYLHAEWYASLAIFLHVHRPIVANCSLMATGFQPILSPRITAELLTGARRRGIRINPNLHSFDTRRDPGPQETSFCTLTVTQDMAFFHDDRARLFLDQSPLADLVTQIRTILTRERGSWLEITISSSNFEAVLHGLSIGYPQHIPAQKELLFIHRVMAAL